MTDRPSPSERRPASHRWILGIFGILSIGFTFMLINAYSGVYEASLWEYPVIPGYFGVGVVAFFALLTGRRHKWAYYVTAACLAAWALRAVQTSLLILADLIFFADWKIARDSISFGHLLLIVLGKLVLAVLSALLVMLFIRFTFGTPSRSYFGLPPWRSRSS